jgi:hypothetical protein
MPCGLSPVREALRVFWKARMYERVRQGKGTQRQARLFCSGPYVWSTVRFDWLEATEREIAYVFWDVSRSYK